MFGTYGVEICRSCELVALHLALFVTNFCGKQYISRVNLSIKSDFKLMKMPFRSIISTVAAAVKVWSSTWW